MNYLFRLSFSLVLLELLRFSVNAAEFDLIRVAHHFKAFGVDSKKIIVELKDLFVFSNYDCSQQYASRKRCDKSFDVATMSNEKVYESYKHWVGHSKKPMTIAFPREPKSLLLFENRFVWKLWMSRINLGNIIPSNMDEKNMTFPSVMKTVSTKYYDYALGEQGTTIRSSSVYLLDSITAYQNRSDELRALGLGYFVEELINTNDLREGTIVGSFYDDALLSMRCVQSVMPSPQASDAKERSAMLQAYDNQNVSLTIVTDPLTSKYKGFIKHRKRGSIEEHSHVHYVKCGDHVAKTTQIMLQSAGYSGAFCIDIKWDSNRQNKMYFLEVNPRHCPILSMHSGLFKSVYLPLAFAIEEKRENQLRSKFEESEDIKTWFLDKNLRAFVDSERNAAMLGDDGRHGQALFG